MNKQIRQLIIAEIARLNRDDLFREPLVAFSDAKDKRYTKLKEIIGDWHQNPTEVLPSARSVISYFVPFTKEVVDEPISPENGSPLWGESYVVINAYFNHINDKICNYLRDEGYTAQAMAPTHTYDPEDLKSTWSHRSAAAISGLGHFGLNRMLITEKGCGGRYGTVITSAPLEVSKTKDENSCLYIKDGSCTLCIDACPVDALTLDGDFKKFTCQDELNKNKSLLEESHNIKGADTCGKCISVCPVAYIE